MPVFSKGGGAGNAPKGGSGKGPGNADKGGSAHGSKGAGTKNDKNWPPPPKGGGK
jgi:hypothetical protein